MFEAHAETTPAATSAEPNEDERRRRRSQAARIGALARWGYHDPKEGTKAARAGFDAKFLRDADPDGVLDPQERERRAQRLKRAHMLGLAQKSAAARAARRQ